MSVCNEKELEFSVFLIHHLAEGWKMLPTKVYQILTKANILDEYIIPSYECLHTLGMEYLMEDISELVGEKGVDI